MYQSKNNSTVYLCPRINRTLDHHAYYGGSQSWFLRNTQFIGGCAAVCGANVITIYASDAPEFQKRLGITIDKKRFISLDDYCKVMHSIYKRILMLEVPIINRLTDRVSREAKTNYILPSTCGTTMIFFILGMKSFARKYGLKLNSNSMYTTNCSYIRGLTYIKLALSNGHPVVLLTTNNTFEYTLYHKAYRQDAKSHTMKKHFVTITDIQESGIKDEPDLIISTWGKTGRISYKELHESWQSPKSFGSSMAHFVPRNGSPTI